MKFIVLFSVTYLLYFVGLLIAPLKVKHEFLLEPVLIFLFGIAAVLLGLFSATLFVRRLRPRFKQVAKVSDSLNLKNKELELIVKRVNLLALAGCLLVLVDRFYFRGLSFGLNFVDGRAALAEVSTSVFGLFGNFLAGLAVFSLGLMFLSEAVHKKWPLSQKIVPYVVTLSFVLTQFSLGSRSGVLVLASVSVLFFMWGRHVRGLPLFSSKKLRYVFYLAIFLSVNSGIFLLRISQMGIDPLYSIEHSAYGYAIQPSDSFYQLLEVEGLWQSLWLGLTSLLLYLYHGTFEFFLLVTDFRGDHTYGSTSFWFPLKILSYLGLADGAELISISGVREGVFTSFLGPLYIDFGLYMPLCVFCLFFVLGLPIVNLSKSSLAVLPYAAMLASTLVLFPAMNLLVSGSGMYPFFAALFIPLLGKKSKISFITKPKTQRYEIGK